MPLASIPAERASFGCLFQYGAGADCKSVAFNTAQLGAVRASGIDSNNTHQYHGRRRVWTQPALKAVATGNGEGSIPSSSASNSSTNREAAGVATWLSTSRDGFNSRAVYQFLP